MPVQKSIKLVLVQVIFPPTPNVAKEFLEPEDELN